MGIPSSELDQARADIEAALMPDTCEIRTVGTTTDRLGKKVRGSSTTTDTVSCRHAMLSGRELEIAQQLAPTTTDVFALPYDATITEAQEVYHQESERTYTVTAIKRNTLGLEQRVYCERIGS